jgi:hypothetical protein
MNERKIRTFPQSARLGLAAVTLHFLAAIAAASSNDFLVPFWGSDLGPAESIGWRASLQLDQFTEFDKDTLRFPLGRKTGDCDYYCETIGFNTLQGTRSIRWRKDLRLSVGAFLGLADDGLTEFLQNEYSHKRNGVAGVPRQGERKGILFGASLEADRDFIPTWMFGGIGFLANNVYHEAFIHSGLILQRQPLFGTRFGIKYSAVTRLGILVPSREFLISGTRYFPSLFPVVGMGQAEAGVYANVFGIPIEFSWRGGYSSGVFINQDRDEAEGMWLEGLKTVIWKFSFERYNDALNGTDYGPTYGVKMNFSP